ncbi:MAG TPA: hypothetical protein VNP20_20885, partial [Nocardioidaceae bacterium]|nr:hypothetical protein [Nocardioidaceae bacterium]
RTLCRHGLTVLVADGGTLSLDGDSLSLRDGADAPPVRVHAMSALVADRDVADALATTLGARPGEAWVVRPDAFVAAVVDVFDPAALQAALSRALSHAEA